MSIPSASTAAQLDQLVAQLTEGDRLRLLAFAEAMLVQKEGKRRQRQERQTRLVVEGWRVSGD